MIFYAKPLVLSALCLAPLTAAMASSISSFCESRGGSIATARNDAGRPTQYCVLKDGSRMNAVAFFRNQHRTME